MFAIPGRLILNDQGVDMSYKDDFSPLTIDTDMSNIDFLCDHLSKMLSAISESINTENYLSKQDILDLFPRHNNEEVFTYMILASCWLCHSWYLFPLLQNKKSAAVQELQ